MFPSPRLAFPCSCPCAQSPPPPPLNLTRTVDRFTIVAKLTSPLPPRFCHPADPPANSFACGTRLVLSRAPHTHTHIYTSYDTSKSRNTSLCRALNSYPLSNIRHSALGRAPAHAPVSHLSAPSHPLQSCALRPRILYRPDLRRRSAATEPKSQRPTASKLHTVVIAADAASGRTALLSQSRRVITEYH